MSNSSRSSTPLAGAPQVTNYLQQGALPSFSSPLATSLTSFNPGYTREVEAAQGRDPSRELYKPAGPAWVGSWGAPKSKHVVLLACWRCAGANRSIRTCSWTDGGREGFPCGTLRGVRCQDEGSCCVWGRREGAQEDVTIGIENSIALARACRTAWSARPQGPRSLAPCSPLSSPANFLVQSLMNAYNCGTKTMSTPRHPTSPTPSSRTLRPPAPRQF